MGEQRLWEKSYPPGVRWDAPIDIATLPALFDAFTAKWAAKPAFEFRDHRSSYTDFAPPSKRWPPGLMDLGVEPRHGRRALPSEYALPSLSSSSAP